MTDAKPADPRLEIILRQLEQLPTLPAVVVRVLEVTGDARSDVKAVTRLIESDPALTARVLQLVARADVGVRGRISTVERAIVLLGFDAVRAATLAVGVFHTFGGPGGVSGGGSGDAPDRALTSDPAGTYDRTALWTHTLAVACAAEALASRLNQVWGKSTGIDPADAFVCGLLHDLGKLALDAALPRSFARVVQAAELLRGDIADAERQVLGTDHLVIGKRLAERWRLPAIVRDCAWLHGQTPAALPAGVADPRMVHVVTLADVLARRRHLGYSGNYRFAVGETTLSEAIGLTPQDVGDVGQSLVGRLAPRAEALGLGRSSDGELYCHALDRANRELGRVTEQLTVRNRRLARRARFFDALCGFQASLRPDSPASAVLSAIARTAAGVMGVGVAAAFSLPPGRSYAETAVADAEGERATCGVAERTDDAPLDGGGGSGAELAGNVPEWLAVEIDPYLPPSSTPGGRRRWLPLRADGVCVGGVIWPDEPSAVIAENPTGGVGGVGGVGGEGVRELDALVTAWGLSLRTCQARDEARALAEQLADANRRLQSAQDDVLRAQTLAGIGEMAAGAAHEMNNPLMVICGRARLLESTLASSGGDEKQQSMARQIVEQSARLSDLITSLMGFARPAPPTPGWCDLAAVLERSDADAASPPQGRVVTTDCPANLPPLWVDAGQLAGVIGELLTNAFAATDPATGRVTLTARGDFAGHVVLTIADNGRGMDATTLEHACDPFFSVKPAGRRRGLGLATAARRVEAGGGMLRIESEPGVGTRVTLVLPTAENRTPVANRVVSTGNGVDGGPDAGPAAISSASNVNPPPVLDDDPSIARRSPVPTRRVA